MIDDHQHNWPEYINNETGNKLHTCRDCNVEFFGYRCRTVCHVCAFKGVVIPPKIKR